jgi:hypothetical protein
LELKISIEEKKGVNIEKYVEYQSIGIRTYNPPFVSLERSSLFAKYSIFWKWAHTTWLLPFENTLKMF